MKQPQNRSGLNIVRPSSKKRPLDEKFTIDPLDTGRKSASKIYAHRVSVCCAEILNEYKYHSQNTSSVIPQNVIEKMAAKHEVSEVKVTRIMNGGRKRLRAAKGSKK